MPYIETFQFLCAAPAVTTPEVRLVNMKKSEIRLKTTRSNVLIKMEEERQVCNSHGQTQRCDRRIITQLRVSGSETNVCDGE